MNLTVLRRSNHLKKKRNTLDRLLEVPSTSEQVEAKKRELHYQDIEKQHKKRQRLTDIEESEHQLPTSLLAYLLTDLLTYLFAYFLACFLSCVIDWLLA